MDMNQFKSKWPSLGMLGLTARRCLKEENCRVLPIQLAGGPNSPLTLSLFIEDGNILGVDVADCEDGYESVFNYGETWDDVDEDDPAEPVFDFLSGEELSASGWTVTRRIDGETKSFASLTGILSALNGGAFGVSLWSPHDLDDPEPTCPEACSGCPDPATCAGLRNAEYPTFEDIRDERDDDDVAWTPWFEDEFPAGMNLREPRGWNAPELS